VFLIAWTLNYGDNDLRDFWGVEADELTANNLLAFHMTHDKFHCGAVAKITTATEPQWMDGAS
jgi:hypothetical protein